MTQYTDYGSIPQAVRDLVANKISLLDSYILMQTGQYEYTALINRPGLNRCDKVVISRTSNYNSDYSVVISTGEWDFNVTNEYYCYSNVGYGAALDLPVVAGVTAHASVILSCALMLAIVFKGVLFKCLRK